MFIWLALCVTLVGLIDGFINAYLSGKYYFDIKWVMTAIISAFGIYDHNAIFT